jgi:hypothetical protein
MYSYTNNIKVWSTVEKCCRYTKPHAHGTPKRAVYSSTEFSNWCLSCHVHACAHTHVWVHSFVHPQHFTTADHTQMFSLSKNIKKKRFHSLFLFHVISLFLQYCFPLFCKYINLLPSCQLGKIPVTFYYWYVKSIVPQQLILGKKFQCLIFQKCDATTLTSLHFSTFCHITEVSCRPWTCGTPCICL